MRVSYSGLQKAALICTSSRCKCMSRAKGYFWKQQHSVTPWGPFVNWIV